MIIKPNELYRHYKGKDYKILAIGTTTETLEKQVVYQALYYDEKFGSNAIWIRPLEMFCETITIDGKEVPRFTKIEANNLAKDRDQHPFPSNNTFL